MSISIPRRGGVASAPSWWAQLALLFGLDVRRTLRDRAAFAFAVGGAVVVALLASVALGGQRPVRTSIAVVVPGEIVTVAEEGLGAFQGQDVDVVVLDDEGEARRRLIEGEFASVVVLPFGDSTTGSPRVIANRSEPIAEAISRDIARVASRPGMTPEFASRLSVNQPPKKIERPLNGAERWGVMLAVFFLFLTVGVVARGILVERDAGTLARLRTANVDGTAILVSKVLTMVLLGLAELAAVFTVLRLVLGAEWVSLVAVAAVAVALTLAVGAIGLFITTVVRTVEQCFAVEVVVAVLLGFLAGGMIPVARLPPWFSRIAEFTPNGIAVVQFRAISAGAGISEVVVPTLEILAFAVVIGVVSLFRARKLVEA